MASDHEDAALQRSQSPQHEADMTSVDSADPVSNHKDIAEIDMASNCEDTALREGQSPHDEADMTSVNSADPVTNRKDTADIDMASDHKGTALQGGLNPGYEDDMAKESVPHGLQPEAVLRNCINSMAFHLSQGGGFIRLYD